VGGYARVASCRETRLSATQSRFSFSIMTVAQGLFGTLTGALSACDVNLCSELGVVRQNRDC
jgi:hypothetical protein